MPVLLKIIFGIVSLFLFVSDLSAQIVFSEVMFDVPGADYDNEFVEFYNCSDSSVNLAGWQFSDSSGFDAIVDAGQGTILQSGQFAVLLDGSYFGNSTVYDTLIPAQALILSIRDKAFGHGGLSNTKGERLSLINAAGQEVAVYRYSANNKPGYSDEKINLCAGDDSTNWANSLVLWGTPGFKNSVTPENFDLGFVKNALRFKPASAIKKGQTARAILTYSNAGTKHFNASVHFLVFVDLNDDGQFQTLEPILADQSLNVDLWPGKQDSLLFTFNADFSGILSVVATLSSALDQNPQNNIAKQRITIIDESDPLKINEIKFLTQKGEPEWAEIYNAGPEALNLRGWALADAADTAWIDLNRTIAPGAFKVLCADSSLSDFYQLPESSLVVLPKFPTLNNDGDVLFLLAPWGDWTEQVTYKKSWLWGEEQRQPSLERINPVIDARLESNWGPSVAAQGATPGKQNSLFEPLRSSKLKLSVDPNPFSPDGDGFEDNTIITVQLPTNAARVRATIYDILGRRINDLSNNRLSGQSLQLIWNGCNARKEHVRPGIYIVFVQILDDRNGLLQEAKTTIDVAR
jgi:hypothetical protein